VLYAVLAIALASVVGLIAGVAPARRASLLDPVESLRAE
jgi:ABC-type antimicrobial peptide transport system permease subunit